MGTRKNARLKRGRSGLGMTAAERTRYVDAVKELKRRGGYDKYVIWHEQGGTHGIHASPLFLPWHRYFILRFEQDLQAIDAKVTLPYWNSAIDNSRDPRSRQGSIWVDAFMGPGGSADPWTVPSGPFSSGWTGPVSGQQLRRSLGREFAGQTLPRPDYVALAVNGATRRASITTYDSAPWNDTVPGDQSFRNAIEGFVTVAYDPATRTLTSTPSGNDIHNQSHVWVGGQMRRVAVSPEDPVFFLHHCNIDRLWARWQSSHPRSAQYPPAGSLPAGRNINEPMWPWDGTVDPDRKTPGDVLSISTLGYTYDDRLSPRVQRS